MDTLIENLNTIDSIKSGIKSAIEDKGVDMTGLSFQDYPAAISQIETGTFNTENIHISANGVYTPDEGYDGFYNVEVSVPASGYTLKDAVENNFAVLLEDSTIVSIPKYGLTGVWMEYDPSLGMIEVQKSSFIQGVSFYSCVNVNDYGFYRQGIVYATLPVCSIIGEGAFYGCFNLGAFGEFADHTFPVCSYIGERAFYDCSYLSLITLGYDGVCLLSNSNAFTGTQITSSTGSIEVPASLVAEYQSAPEWSYFSTQIVAIPEGN